eukprot:14046955-Alexandrium_andersonii.AAC.1
MSRGPRIVLEQSLQGEVSRPRQLSDPSVRGPAGMQEHAGMSIPRNNPCASRVCVHQSCLPPALP